MIAENIISNSLVHLHIDDTIAQALTIMHINYVKHLPVVSENKLIGIASEENLLKFDDTKTLREFPLEGVKISAKLNDHMFELLGKINENHLTSLPVLDLNGNYAGLISQEDLLKTFANSFSVDKTGSLLVLEVNRRSYSLSEISRIVELENASIISSFITELEESVNVLVTLKINSIDIQAIIKAFDRYGYEIRATYAEKEVMDNLKERYDSLMKFLNV